MSIKNLKPLILLLIVIGGLMVYFLTPLRQFLAPSYLMAVTQSARDIWWLPIVLILSYGIGGVFGLPGSALTLVIGAFYGLVPGFFYNVLAANLAAMTGFLTARYLGRSFAKRFLKGRWKELDEKAARHGCRVIFYLRLVPLFPFNAINFGTGFSKIHFRDYCLSSIIGMIPGTFVDTYFASSLVAGIGEARKEVSLHLILSSLLFVLLSLMPTFYKKLHRT